MNPEILELRERLRTDTVFWAEHCATIVNAQRKPQKLAARPWQLDFDAALEKQRAAGQPMRAIILKARKLGFSTWVQAKLMQRVTQEPFQYALTVAHRRDAATVLFDMATLIYKRLPNDAQIAEMIYGAGTNRPAPFSVRPDWLGGSETRDGGGWFSLGDTLRKEEKSVYQTMTAGSSGGGRSSTPSTIHASEVAQWEDADYLTGLFNALPLEAETVGVLESTARGFNHFHTLWQRAVEGAEDEDLGGLWTPLFYGWQDNPYNSFPFRSDEARDRFERTIGDPQGGGDEDEPWLVEAFGVTLEQLNWRRIVRDGPECQGDIEKFHQEHPATPEQAFIGSGRSVFPAILVAKMISAAEKAPEPVEGVLRGEDWKERKTRSGTILIPQRAVWVPHALMRADDRDLWPLDARLLVWEHPVNAETQAGLEPAARRPDGQYIAFVDVAQGEGGDGEDRDYSVIQVLDHVTRLQVARYRSRITIHELPLLVLLVAVYFNEAQLAVEKTGLGIGVVDALAKDYRYRRMYRTRRPGDDQRAEAIADRVGWETTPRTKPLMEQSFGQMLKSGEHGCRDVPTGREATTYVEDPKNAAKHGAQKGSHDDLLMAFMGAHRVAAELRPRDPEKKRKVRGRRVDDPLTGW